MELVGGKWRLLIVVQLLDKPLRLSELKALIPDVSEKMLVQELRFLVDSGLVERVAHTRTPPKVEYSLTPQGRRLLPLIEEMRKFAEGYTNNHATKP
jgi:DNA-binding HxlR family transcriptional regulator